MRHRPLLILLMAVHVTACAPVQQTPTMSNETTAAPATDSPPLEMVWRRAEIDADPGSVVIHAIANALEVPVSTVTAAMFAFSHPAGNAPFVWVFRVDNMASGVAADRWVRAEAGCGSLPERGSLADRPAILIQRSYIDQCQPTYLVALDDRTLAVIVDDGGYQGTAADVPPVPYRPAVEIAQLVGWLQRNVPATPFVTAGPFPGNG